MKKIFFFLSVLGIVHTGLYAQHDLYVGAYTDLGVPVNGYGQGRKVLTGRGLNFQSNFGLMAQYKAFNRIGIELGVAQDYSRWQMQDKNFAHRHSGYKARVTNNHYYLSYHAAVQIFQPVSDKASIYIGGGIDWNKIGKYSKSLTKNFSVQVDTSFVDEDVTSSTNYQASNIAYYGELGIQQKISDKTTFSFGVKLNLGQSELGSGTYHVYDLRNSGQEVANDRYTSWGDYVGFNMKLAYNLWHKDKHVRVPKIKPDPVVVDKKPIPPVDNQPKPKPQPTKVEGRDVKVTNKLVVKNQTIKIYVWDHQEIDGDRISLKLDEMWILQNYTLSAKKKEVVVTLKPGENFLTLHALNLGKHPPNTAAILVLDGTESHTIVLESTLEQSGTIEITFNK